MIHPVECASDFYLWAPIAIFILALAMNCGFYLGIRHKKIYVTNPAFVKVGLGTANLAAIVGMFVLVVNQGVCR
jgi:hypothetical protein